MHLYGREWTRREIEMRVSRMEQIGGIRRMVLTEGREAGVELIQIRTGAGLSYYVSPMRGMDISLAEFAGVPISWQSANGDVHPSYYNPDGTEWGRTAAGGLLMTCGLTQVGSPCEEGGRKFGQHGTVHHTPAKQISASGEWKGDEYEMTVRGIMGETSLFGERLQLTRQIQSRLGENKISIEDVVENVGFATAAHMILYHFNFGFPLMDEETKITFPSRRVSARDEGTPIDGYNAWQAPELGYAERVYYHEELATEKGTAYGNEMTGVIIRNPRFPCVSGVGNFPISVKLSWDTSHLMRLVEWKMPAAGLYVLGIEPANCHVEGRVVERERGTLVLLDPGEIVTYRVEIEITADRT